MKKLVAIVLLSVYFLFPAYSFGETPTPTKPSEKSKVKLTSGPKAIATDQRGTEQAPLVIKILPSAQSEEPTAKENEKHENDSAHWLWEQWLNHWPEILLAFFTLGLWIATWQLVRGAKDTTRRQLRAYISILGGEMKEGDQLGFMVKFKNSGQTPAYELVSGTRWEVAPYPNAGILAPVPLTDKSRSTLGPGISTGLFASRTNLTPDEKMSLENMTAAIYIHGRIEYRDAFKEPRVTNFRLIYRKNHAGHYLIGNDREGNDAT